MKRTRPKCRSSIPRGAREVVEERHPNGAVKSAYYYVGRRRVGRRWFYDDGTPEWEYGLRSGRKHGVELKFYDSGALMSAEPYRDGKIHGTARQWSEDGRLLVTYRLRHGTGLDLWCCTVTGRLSEETWWRDGRVCGFVRWWNDDEKTVWWEQHFDGRTWLHGIQREWDDRGRLRRGFPRYYVHGERVGKRQYLKACEANPTLPRYRPEDDDPRRELPAEYVRQRGKGKRK